MARVVWETETTRCFVCLTNSPTSEVLPAPEGAEKINKVPGVGVVMGALAAQQNLAGKGSN